MVSKTDSKLIVLHRLSFQTPPIGVTNEPWHQKPFPCTDDQIPQTMQFPALTLSRRTLLKAYANPHLFCDVTSRYVT
jgi:hypothetical protein